MHPVFFCSNFRSVHYWMVGAHDHGSIVGTLPNNWFKSLASLTRDGLKPAP